MSIVEFFGKFKLRDGSLKMRLKYLLSSIAFICFTSVFFILIMSCSAEDYWGIIDKTGKWIIPHLGNFKNIENDGCFGDAWVDKSGKLEQNSASLPHRFYDGLARVSINGKFGYIDKNGKTVVAAQFLSADRFIDKRAWVTTFDKITKLIDTLGNTVLILPPEYEKGQFAEGKCICPNRNGSGCLIIDKLGKTILKSPKVFYGFHEGRSKFVENAKYGFINSSGTIVILPIFDYASNFSESMCVVKRNISVDIQRAARLEDRLSSSAYIASID